jgi:hypothetical protein
LPVRTISDLGNHDLNLVLVLHLGDLLWPGALPAAKNGTDPAEAPLSDKGQQYDEDYREYENAHYQGDHESNRAKSADPNVAHLVGIAQCLELGPHEISVFRVRQDARVGARKALALEVDGKHFPRTFRACPIGTFEEFIAAHLEP